ncbi:glycosyltransferase [Massilia sp. R2A-15]|uniref:glycosyltransferase n=1 Tax=Massilia sp. R2A-15 TaxID=3064278 RepID=UPI002736A7C7|nr:glycosyltransferase [Massilia sp. R2A-15]WLI90241.1 glycosyltransferase [Massilia sp. R2A-15]
MKRIAFIVRDPLPPTRADVATLFGAELPRHGIDSELIGQGKTRSVLALAASPLRDALGLWRARRVDGIQVRDKIASGVLARVAAAILGVPFVYWMSFPVVEGFEARRDEIGRAGRGPRWAAHALRARVARLVLYRLVLPGARHVFVQSDAMASWLAGQGVPRARMSAVPMGVDAALFERAAIEPARDPRLDGRRVILYLGRVSQSRQSGFLLDVVEALRRGIPGILLVIAGDASSSADMAWMRGLIGERRLGEHVVLTGWLPQRKALRYAVRAEVALSPLPRGTLFDGSSPAKLMEYLALGIPCVASDIPDQALAIEQSGAGVLAPMLPGPFSEAVRALLDDPAQRARLAKLGPPWVARHRTYAILGAQVAETYERILPEVPRVLMIGTAPGGRGGIASVVGVLRAGGLFERAAVRYVVSHRAGAHHVGARAALSAFLSTVAACLRRRPEVVHVHSATRASFARKSLLLLLARAAGCRTIFHLHGAQFGRFAATGAWAPMRWWIRRTLERSTAVIALSDRWAAFVRGYAPAARVVVVPNAVALPASADRSREERGRILFLGRADAGKGVFDLLAAVALLAPALPHIRLVIGGAGQLALLRRRAEELGIGARVILPGWLDARAREREMARAQVFCLPSHAEGLPMAMLEAMAAGKAIVASAVGGVPDAIADGANGVLVAPRDPAALAAALGKLLASRALRECMGDAASATVRERFSAEGAVGALSALYRELGA